MCFSAEDGRALEELEALEMEIQPYLDIPMDEELERREAEVALHPEAQADAGEVHGDDGPGAHQPCDGGRVQDPPLEVEPLQEVQIVVGEVIPAQIEVDGQVLTAASSLATLRAACGFYGVACSGSKSKCYHRLCQHHEDHRALLRRW